MTFPLYLKSNYRSKLNSEKIRVTQEMILKNNTISHIIKKICSKSIPSSFRNASGSSHPIGQYSHNQHQIHNHNAQSFLFNTNKFPFSQATKASQLILYSQQQIERLHASNSKNKQKNSKDSKTWQVYKQKTDKFKVSLVGLPNCGKSSLFNCMIGERLAIVDKQYGMTRDRREYTILNGMVGLIDTPGVEANLLSTVKGSSSPFKSAQLQKQQIKKQLKSDIFQQTLSAINQSDMILLIIDSKKGVISQDQIILGKYLKAFNHMQNSKGKKCQIVIVCNKCDGLNWDQFELQNEIYSKLPNFGAKPKKSNKDKLNNEKQNNEENDATPKQSKLEQISQQTGNKIFYCSAQQGSGIFQILQYINSRIPYELKQNLQRLHKERRQKFQKLVKKLKEQIKEVNQGIDKKNKQEEEDEEKQANKGFQSTQEKQANASKSSKKIKRYKIKQWEKDFRNLNPNPQENQQLDNQNYQEFFIRPQETFSNNLRGVDMKNIKMKNSIKICFIGRPNVGKSSLINEILGEEKMVVSEVPHTTRDSLTTKILYKNRKIQLIDTAGLNTPRFQQNQQEYLKKAQISTMLHVQQSHVVVYVMDSYSAFKVDDFKIINQVIKQGRPILIVVNKWQALRQQYRNKAKNYLFSQIDKNLGQLHGHPVVFVSAKMLLNIDQMMDQIINIYDKWNKRISTGLLNNWLQKFKKLDNLPKDEQRTLRINYVIQAKVRPPHFILFVNNKQIFKPNYMRFLMRNISEEFDLDGIPIRNTLRSTNNKQNEWKEKKLKKQAKKGKERVKKESKTKEKMEQLKKKYGDFTI